MPWGLVVLAALSWAVFRRARDVGRNPFGWVVLLWAALFVGSAVGMCPGALLINVGFPQSAALVGALAGMVAAVGVVLRAAGTPAAPVRREVVAVPDEPAPPVAPPDGRCPHCGVRLLAVRDAFCPDCRGALE